MPEKHWKSIGTSRFPWEQEALDFVFQGFPAQDNCLAWSLFEFLADDGSMNEIDLFVVWPGMSPTRARLDHPGVVRADSPTECEYGPMLFLRTDPEAQRLDHFLQANGAALDVGQRLEILRQLTEDGVFNRHRGQTNT